ncbi:hypothetical protein OKC48_06900 [Methylorubrum extorquens]|uniref:hypothetical protein n=1 Tax=Methylorubrum extorquens TaxID=408 RepID=UPI002238E0E7|nr:hypothetical protein [Methylorubrum extorquens]UYW28242.1 hypothetical protein OKC48_06900 [Methylorubrum extorquens]
MRLALLPALVAVAVLLGGCPDRAALDLTVRPALPPIPADLEACLHRSFPEIPARAFGRREAVRIIADAKLLDRAKSACGDRALEWMKGVSAAFGRPTP